MRFVLGDEEECCVIRITKGFALENMIVGCFFFSFSFFFKGGGGKKRG